MNTVIVGNRSLPKLVWIHGYGSSNALYYKVFEKLKEEYCLLLIDMIGMGSSSRPNNFDKRSLDA